MLRLLTKSRFKLAVECPTKLFYTGKKKQYKDKSTEDSFLATLAEGGYQVGALAQALYPEGIEISPIEHVEAVRLTNDYLQREDVILFEPAFLFNNLFVRVDILIKKGRDVQLIEVKAKSYDSVSPKIESRAGISTPMRPYIEDVAFQAYVVKQSFPHFAVRSFLMMPDKSREASVDGLNQLFKIHRENGRSKVVVDPKLNAAKLDKDLLALVPVDKYVDLVMSDGVQCADFKLPLIQAAQDWATAYASDIKIPPSVGAHCGRCQFRTVSYENFKSGFEECWETAFHLSKTDLASGTVLDLWNYRGKAKLISDGRVRLSAVQREDLGDFSESDELSNADRQWLQVSGIPSEEDREGYWLASGLMQREMDSWVYPLHLIDFETSSVALPFYKGMRPYEQIAFQFSHHVMHSDGRIEHAGEFLSTEPGKFPNFDFARELMSQLGGDQGTVFMWSPHENTILNRIAKQLAESTNPPVEKDALIEFLQSLTKGGQRAMYDLCDLSRRAYFHTDTKGSNSIKKVLPALLAATPELTTRFSSPIYGSVDGVKSLNYKDFVWCKKDATGAWIEPYELLKDEGRALLGENIDPDDLLIADGGAAASAYSRLQFESLNDLTRRNINSALLKYCELDTLAMVLIILGWQEAK